MLTPLVLLAALDQAGAVSAVLAAAPLPGLTSGEGVAKPSFAGYRPVTGPRT